MVVKGLNINKDGLVGLNEAIKFVHESFSSQANGESNVLPEPLPADVNDVSGIFNGLIRTLTFCVKQVCDINNNKVNESVLLDKIRVNEDETDEVKQRSMKGNLIVSSIAYENKTKPCLIKTDAQLAEEDISLTKHAQQLVQKKFGVNLPEEDIQAVHRLSTKVKSGQTQNEAFILRINNRRPGSAWHGIVQGIKTGAKVEENVFFNFQLTKKRADILHKVRGLKKETKIHKFYTDENGKIQILVKEGQKNVSLTYAMNPRTGQPAKTLTVQEIDNILK